jgi:hypothetical protein
MTIYYVDGNTGNDSTGDGSGAKPWQTLGKARTAVKPGDEVRIRTATYREILNLAVPDVTWKADAGHEPILDGGYHDGLFDSQGNLPSPITGDYLPRGAGNGNMINVTAAGIILDGLTVRNSAGSGIGLAAGASNCVVRNCTIDFHYTSAIKANPPDDFIDNVIIENNVCTRLSVRFFDSARQMWGVEGVSGIMRIQRTRDCIIRNNVCAYSYGEGFNINNDAYRTVIESNVVHTCRHAHIYISHGIDTIIRNNLVFHLFTPGFSEEDSAPTGILIGDERVEGSLPSSGGQIYNNIVVGLGDLFWVRNNTFNYDTQLTNCYTGHNTFVAGEKTVNGIRLVGNQQGRPHENSLFENNIIAGAPTISLVNGDVSGITFRNNLGARCPRRPCAGRGTASVSRIWSTPRLNSMIPFPIPTLTSTPAITS